MTGRWLLAAVTVACLTGCRTVAPLGPEPAARPPSLVDTPAVLWINEETLGPQTNDPAMRQALYRAARVAGITHLAVEVQDGDGRTMVAPRLEKYADAREAGVFLAAVVSPWLAPPDAPGEHLRQSAIWTEDGYEVAPPTTDGVRWYSPASDEARRRALALIREVLRDPGVDMLVLANAGFGDLASDAGAGARRDFAAWSGRSVRSWPADVFGTAPRLHPVGGEGAGPLWPAWTAWRAALLRTWLMRVREATLLAHPSGAPPGLVLLVDAPYTFHQREGFNWALPQADLAADFPWLPRDYGITASGHLVDAVALGFWEPRFTTAAEAEEAGYAWWASVEGSLAAARRVRPSGSIWAAVDLGAEGWDRAMERSLEDVGGVLLVNASSLVGDQDGWVRLAELVRRLRSR